MTDVRTIEPSDLPATRSFLVEHAASTMFLRGNLLRVGLVDRGERFEGTYVGAFDGDRVVAVAAHYWNGNLILEAPTALAEVVAATVAASGREVKGILGRSAQVRAAQRALGLGQRTPSLDSEEGLFSLELAQLRVPEPLESGAVVCREPHEDELELLARWRAAFHVESLGATDAADQLEACRAEIANLHHERQHWLLEVDGAPVAYSAFNSSVPDCVQVGGVWTPPELRGRGYARAVVAGTLLLAREAGATRSILFTENPAAERAYRALGYDRVGNYVIVLYS